MAKANQKSHVGGRATGRSGLHCRCGYGSVGGTERIRHFPATKNYDAERNRTTPRRIGEYGEDRKGAHRGQRATGRCLLSGYATSLNPLEPLREGTGPHAFACRGDTAILQGTVEGQAAIDEQHKGFGIAAEYNVSRSIIPVL
jgi:hypothetical protein